LIRNDDDSVRRNNQLPKVVRNEMNIYYCLLHGNKEKENERDQEQPFASNKLVVQASKYIMVIFS